MAQQCSKLEEIFNFYGKNNVNNANFWNKIFNFL